jgi:uncharacterized protein YjlB
MIRPVGMPTNHSTRHENLGVRRGRGRVQNEGEGGCRMRERREE